MRLRIVFLLAFLALSASAATPSATNDTGWPRQITTEGQQFTIYQPQIEKWQDNELEERAAVSVLAPQQTEPVFGVVWIKARTEVDKTERLVTLEDLEIKKVDFPSAKDKESDYLNTLKNNSSVLRPVSLDRLQASLAIAQVESKRKAPNLKNDPPQIFYSAAPSLLIPIDGKPILRGTQEPDILRVVNTRAPVFLDQKTGNYYFSFGNRWMTSPGLESRDWRLAKSPPSGVTQAKKQALDSKAIDEIKFASNAVPKVFVGFGPSELVQTNGSPQFQPVADTTLLYVKNAPSNVFLETSDQNYYVLLSGRWYRSKSLEGQWSYVSAQSLPADFSKIPEGHPKGEVLASVAGTPQAKEAAISNEIPQTATVDRQQAGIAISYDGPAQFKPIEGTPLQYAENTRTPVIEVDPHSFYSVQNGVWFVATSPEGPWVIASKVPAVIYTIPPSSPLYYVTYVYVYGSTPQYVYVGYLPGYLGSYVSPDGVVVYGTGYVYPDWVGTVWYGPPVTFGFGIGWGFGFGWGFSVGYFGGPCVYPWWGPWHWHGPQVTNVTVVNINHTNVYRTWSSRVVVNSPQQRGVVGGPQNNFNPGRFNQGGFNRSNNVFADRQGNIYRHSDQGWERYQNKSWQKAPIEHQTPPHELEQERMARELGQTRTQQYASHPSIPAAPPHAASPGSFAHGPPGGVGGGISHSGGGFGGGGHGGGFGGGGGHGRG